jgi:hypothetical protein|tara:strand:+ start:5664 stop:6806 length:1143 start_codon:yes stop_codon:yes gene_type:complete
MTLDLTSIDDSYLLFIRSREVTQMTENFNSNMKVNLVAQIGRNSAFADIHVQLSSCEIPHSFYNFSSNLNNLSLNVDSAPSLVLTEQHYDIYELCDYITNDSTFKYSATFYPQKNKIILTNTDSTGYTINFGNEQSKNLAKALGFKQIDVVMSADESIISDNSVNLNTIHSIFVHTDLSIANCLTTSTGNYTNIIQKIPVNTTFNKVINYSPIQSSVFSSVLNVSEINSLEISLKDQNGNLIQFNEASFELSLLFEIHNVQTQNQDLSISGGRRSDLSNEVINNPINNPNNIVTNNPTITSNNNIPSINNFIIPNNNNPSNNNINLPKELTSSNIGFSSQPRITQSIPLPVINEDSELNDKQSNILQNKLLELEMLDDIL